MDLDTEKTKIMKRILEVKKKIGNLSKNSKNPFFKSAYLDLNGLLNAVEPLLQEQGLVLIQPIEEGEVFSRIIDSDSGNIIIESGIMLPNLTDPQKLGSAITYFRRYTLKSLLAIAESDDDGNLASAKPKLKDDELKTALAEGSADDLRTLLTDYAVTDIQKQAITLRGKELTTK